jgi:hypothetical protein
MIFHVSGGVYMPLGGVDWPLEKDYKDKSTGLLGFKSQ